MGFSIIKATAWAAMGILLELGCKGSPAARRTPQYPPGPPGQYGAQYGPWPAPPLGAPAPAPPTPAPSPARVVSCGYPSACSGAASVCCTGFGGHRCVRSSDECARAENGEVTFSECDGPEDCRPGQSCCSVTEGRTMNSAVCLDAALCSGDGESKYGRHPRLVICRSIRDCPPWTGATVCEEGQLEPPVPDEPSLCFRQY